MVKASVHQLFPSEEVQARLATANLDTGYSGLSEAVDACCNPAELRWAVLGFRNWAGDRGAAAAEVASVWTDLCAMSDVLARIVPQPDPGWSGRESGVWTTATTSPEVSERLQGLEPLLIEAFTASSEVSEQRRQAAWTLGFSRVPLEWAPVAMA